MAVYLYAAGEIADASATIRGSHCQCLLGSHLNMLMLARLTLLISSAMVYFEASNHIQESLL